MTYTLETALADLPAKPRVHELSKRVGTTSKEMLAVLAERGLTIGSASASVPREVAIAVIEHYLGPPDRVEAAALAAEAPPPAAAQAEAVASPDEAPSPPAVPTAASTPVADPLNPLFLPPTEVTTPTGRSTADDESEQDELAPAESAAKRPRRRRGRSSGRRDTGVPVDTDEQVEADGPVVAVEPAVELTEAADEAADESADETAEQDETGGEGAGRRRRRRGRRGRGRVAEGDDQLGDEETDRDESAASTESAVSTDEGAEPDDTEEEESADTADTDEGTAAGGTRRRRRRRRRASGDDAAPREDDPDNTVVHVREARGSGPPSASSAASNEVQGVRGSTRLEAKRQRRRDSRDSSRRRPQILTEAEFLARRESVARVMAVRQRGDLAQVALLEDGILVEHFVSQTGADSLIGSVFLGKVQNVLPSMEAAFVDIGRGRNAVIYAGEVNWDAAGLGGKARRIESALSSGDTILAQVSKDPVGHKGARLTTQISLPGRFLVYVPGGGATGISRKLPDTERKRLKAILDRIVPEDAGVIIRTAAEGVSEDELARDVERLKAQWAEISRRAEAKGSAPTPLYSEPGTLIKVVRDLFNSDISRLVVDGDGGADTVWEPVFDYVNAVAPELADRLVRWDNDGQDVFANYRIDEQIVKALERKVHLPSGGSLVIDRTEAMTVVDVNTGKYTGSGGNLEETVTKNNLEAAEEIVRQLRLRDIGGIIVVDFIDMVLESNRELVMRRLTEALGRDRTRHQVAEVTSLGLVQMTRKRMGTGLVEAFSEPCPHCGGRGIVLHDLPVATAALEPAPATARGKGRRRGRDGGRAAPIEEIVIPRVEMAAGRRPDPRGPKPPPYVSGDNGAHEDEPAGGIEAEVEFEVETEQATTAQRAADLVMAVADAASSAAEMAGEPVDPTADERVDEAPAEIVVTVEPEGPAEPIEIEPVHAEPARIAAPEPVAEPARVVAPEPVAAPEPPARRRRSAGRPAGAPSTAAAAVDMVVDVVVAEGSSNGSESGREQPAGGYLVEDDTPVRTARRAASRPAGPSASVDGEEAVVVTVPAQP
jgi:ribonuclease E